MNLSIRLTAVAYIIRECIRGFGHDKPVVVADIGCDHGYLGIYLCERDIIANGRILACDLRKGPLKIAGKNINVAGLSDRIETRLSDGLEKIKPGEADIITVNGMGGELIFDILKRGEQVLKSASCAVVSPQSKLPAFRYCMRRCNVHISREEVVYDSGKYYHIFVLDELEKADFSALESFADPDIGDLSYEDYIGVATVYGVYTEELHKKKKLLEDAESQIKNEHKEDGSESDKRLKDRICDMHTEIGFIERALVN